MSVTIREAALKRLIAAIALGLTACGLAACGQGAAPLQVTEATYRAPLGSTGIGVAYLSVTSPSADRIVGVSSPQADRVEMHASVMSGDQVSMKQLQEVVLPAGKPVEFAPGGMHLMVFGPKPLAEGATFPIQIELESGRTETISLHPALR
ncbi:MAG: copper chaperone PCu(A)C [Burkholderiales bacterium]|nr:MAG: copper chaperone PCu(A)C [Burkholderiales bacterium]